MAKKVLAALAGLLSAILIVSVGDALAGYLAPPPANLNLKDPVALTSYVAGLPVYVLVVMLCFWLLSSLAAGYISTRICPSSGRTLGLICGGVLLVGALLNMAMLPHPVWLMLSTIVGYIPAAMFGTKLALLKDKT
ncbi:MAG: hypothetical protein J0L94_12895 [Rhodothermia bacterium]|nr:hypothetical protein [Rhodothermia bacterium]